jgi:hypothetical protein
MLRKPPRDPKTVGSFAELRQHYQTLWRELDDCRRMKSAVDATLQSRTKEVRGTQLDLKKAQSQVALITKKAAAQKSFRETSGWSAGAIGSVTLMWAAFGEYGYPGPSWLFEHEIFYGAVCWVATTIFAWAAKGYYGAD